MKQRIKEVRKEKRLSQEEFSKTINISRSNLASIETGAVGVTDRVISDICSKFGVNEVWLRTGEGEMFRPISRDEEIARFVGSALSGETPEIRRHLLHVLSILDESQWAVLADIAEKLYAEHQAENAKKD